MCHFVHFWQVVLRICRFKMSDNNFLSRINTKVETCQSRINGLQRRLDRIENHELKTQSEEVTSAIEALERQVCEKLKQMDSIIEMNGKRMGELHASANEAVMSALAFTKQELSNAVHTSKNERETSENVFRDLMHDLKIRLDDKHIQFSGEVQTWRLEFHELLQDITARQAHVERDIKRCQMKLVNTANLRGEPSQPRGRSPAVRTVNDVTVKDEIVALNIGIAQKAAIRNRSVSNDPTVGRLGKETENDLPCQTLSRDPSVESQFVYGS